MKQVIVEQMNQKNKIVDIFKFKEVLEGACLFIDYNKVVQRFNLVIAIYV